MKQCNFNRENKFIQRILAKIRYIDFYTSNFSQNPLYRFVALKKHPNLRQSAYLKNCVNSISDSTYNPSKSKSLNTLSSFPSI
nr:MAG TPA: hypothetical protein [Caudoviricetes sp.]